MVNTKKKSLLLLAGMLFSAAVFAYSSYSLWYEFLRWSNLVLVGLNFALAMLAFAFCAAVCGEALAKKNRKKSSRFISAAAGALCYGALFWGVTYIHNADGTTNRLAVKVATSLCVFAFGIMFVIYSAAVSKRVFKGLFTALCVVFSAASVIVSGIYVFDYAPTEKLYPVYRLAVAQGGSEIGENSGVYYTYARSTQKAQPTMNLDKKTTLDLHLARNEREGFQIFVVTDKKNRSVSLNFDSAEKGSLPFRIYKEIFNETGDRGTFFSNEFADALVEIKEGEEVELEKNRVQAFYVETLSSSSTPAGIYLLSLTVSAKSENAEWKAETGFTAEVWDFTLPETPMCETAVGISGGEFYKLNGAETEEEKKAIYKSFYDYLLEHKISPYSLPFDILDERADAYMSDPRVTSFLVPYPADDELLKQYYEKVTSNPEWAEKAYFYPIDEPCDEEAIASYNSITDRLKELCPGYSMVTPFCVWKIETADGDKSMIELQKDRSSILCGCSNNVVEGDNTLNEMYAARDSLSSKLWFYVCCGPQGDYNNNFIYQDAIQHRELFWQEKLIDFDGFLYWSSTYCEKGNPWETGKTWDNYDCAGDGCFVYPGAYAGIDGPVGTIRLKNLTDGLDDYDYLTLAEEKFGSDWMQEKISRIMTSFTEYSTDYELLESVRCEIGEALAK